MALIDAFPGVSNKVDSTKLRKDLAGLIVRDTNGVPRGGIFPRHANALISARSDMKLNVAAFEGVSVRGGGPLFMANDGDGLSPLIPIPLANSQTSVIYFKQNESGSPYLDANDLPFIGVISGAASASPVKPSIAGIAGAEELGTVTVPFDATATNSNGVVVTPTHRFTTTAGGVILFRTTAERDLYLTAAPGQLSFVAAGAIPAQWSGSGWRKVSAGLLGAASVGQTLAGTAYTDLTTLTATSYGGQVIVDWDAVAFNGSSGLDRAVIFRVVCDGVAIGLVPAGSTTIPLSGLSRVYFGYKAWSTPPAGSHTWKLQVTASAASAVFVEGAAMTVTEY
ncbi:hypothetical protein E3T37_03645 [Cryobacterium sp. TMT2-10]|uniref:hypothetical protein n=1 Tax=Cryobacterium sp. TMT2-10 TaxID=1259244 RepID=UPI00106B410A|nr:hypothetical protein [Cryobacterium sp. TMT2-10]TFD41758.1 hypothetical protein E3T37_03645 [Cryobacterium sp. TMT2-10]